MAKKAAADPAKARREALQVLATHLGDSQPKVLYGTAAKPGFFKGSGAAVKAAAAVALREGWLSETDERTGSGRNAKSLFAMTPAGTRAVVEESESAELLRHLAESVSDRLKSLEAVRKELELLRPTVTQALQRVTSPPAARPESRHDSVDAEIESVAGQYSQARYLPLRTLYTDLRKGHSELSIGQFHDALRRLHAERRIQLYPYSGSIVEIADDPASIFLGGEVMTYVGRP